MSRLSIVLLFLKPMLSTAAVLLRAKDANSTGADDEAANAIEFLITRLDAYENPQPEPTPES